MWIHVNMCACEGQRSMSGVFLNHYLPCLSVYLRLSDYLSTYLSETESFTELEDADLARLA